MIKSKKGTIFHWIVFGLLVSVGLFVLLVYDAEIAGVKGDWQLDYLQNYYLEGQKELVKVDQTALFAANKVVHNLANNAGFVGNSGCGSSDGFQYWNNGDEFCPLNMESNFASSFMAEFKKHNEDNYEISYQGEEVIGLSDQILTISEDGTSHSIGLDFRIDINYDFDEYSQLRNEAAALLSLCKDNQKLQSCLETNKLEHWKFNDCVDQEFTADGRKVPFCLESPGGYAVRYKVGLDFS